ncbi:tetratricopeptide repeat protein [Desulfolithobacter sp.]
MVKSCLSQRLPGRLLWCLIPAVLLGGCVAGQQVIDPYKARSEREAAMQAARQQEVREPAPLAPAPAPGQPSSPHVADVSPTIGDDLLMPVLALINDRIYAYEQKLEAWKEFRVRAEELGLDSEQQEKITSCQEQLQNLYVGYNGLHEALLQEDRLDAARLLATRSLLELEKKDIEFLEGDCPGLISGSGGATLIATTRSRTLQEIREAIDQAMLERKYDEVIRLYREFTADPKQQPPYDMTYRYGMALLKSREDEAARDVFLGLLEELKRQDAVRKQFELMQLVGDLQFGMEQYEAAKKQYNDIVDTYSRLAEKNEWALQQLASLDVGDQQADEVRAYADLLRAYLEYIPDRDGYLVVEKARSFIDTYPYSPVASAVDRLLKTVKDQADTWFNTSIMARIDSLAGEKKYQEALELLQDVDRGILPAEKQQLLKEKTEELTTLQAIEAETRRLQREQELQEQWNRAMAHLEAKEYDQAIEIFSSFLDNPSYAGKARQRIDEAARLAAQEDRRRAAELFVRANRTHDLESRKKLLFASRRLLQDILVKYPQTDLTDKVKRNLQRIEEEIAAIDPALLDNPTTVDGTPVEPEIQPSITVPIPGDKATGQEQ